ncbi:DUF2236 domain-containing protein [Sphingobacterium alkalisoli]|uniref:DUF2236 domain-containing protein n=1 Tax=Sphingobacterium alkalisoli TaxID=1874115 RepID=A0A4U0H1T4_9SPHI|nr:oxygenase MpaB family protein [Sphingobacterium alkalisoli]TJY65561.1 DUF2236 domain-containing protein [Sphingobacterium alkalisoli]GGH19724.1 hypothetical protein GCM10011418_24370 [Sphingobacterium alkalisoli]
MTHIPYLFKYNNTSFAHYWSKGVGKELLDQLGYVPNLAIAEKFIPLLYQWDRVGDQVIHDLFTKTGFSGGNASLFDYIDQKPLAEAQKDVFDNFFRHVDPDPEWLDRRKLQIGAELSRRPGLTSLIVLRDYCLMGGYESAAINKPLIYTGALKKGAAKRLTETVEFWVQIMKEDALEIPNTGFKSVLSTRMIHSFSRVNILGKTDWDSNKWGIPLNSWDMLATNLGFSLVFLVGLRRMGIQPSEEEVDGLFHLWKYIGYLLGIPIQIIPENENEAIEALFYWTMTQREGDGDTLALATALKDEPIHAYYPKQALMRQMMREIHLYYNRYLLGDYSCNQLGLPSTTIGRAAIINIWKTKKQEKRINEIGFRENMIVEGGREQENVRLIYQKFNSQ